jgi:transposase
MSIIMRSYRIRAYPNGAQRRLLGRWFGAARWLWNTALGIRSEAYRVCGLTLTGNDVSRWLTQWKHTPGHQWLAEAPATCLTQCLRDQDAAFSEVRRQLTYKSHWYGKILVEVDRWYPSSKTCSKCQHRQDALRLDERQWGCPRCGSCHDRDINAARNLLAEGLRQLAGCDDRDLRVDAGDACPEESILVQVLADEARSGQRNRACLEQASFS